METIRNTTMISRQEAFRIIDKCVCHTDHAIERIPVAQALGRIVAEDQIARLDMPPFNKSAMDGYAVPASDQRARYQVLETVAAGHWPTCVLRPGTAAKVMTGAPVPAGTGRVIMVEHTKEVDGIVSVHEHSQATHICARGEDVTAGQTILKAPARIGPLEMANLIAVGITEVMVAAPVTAVILCTGDEIADSPDQLAPGRIMNSNGPLLTALSRKHGIQVVCNEHIPDSLDATIQAIGRAAQTVDIVVLSGGVSVGDFDYVAEAVRAAGFTIHFNRLAVKPGKPMTFATSGCKALFGLPGNPVAVFLMFHLFVLRSARLLGGLDPGPRITTLPLHRSYRRGKAERLAYIPCNLIHEGTLKPVTYHGTAHLSALMQCDGFFVVPQGVKELAGGAQVEYISIRDSFS